MSSSSPAAAAPTADPVRDARQAGLVYVSDTQPGIIRVRSGKGFCYRLPDGSVLRDRDELARIRALAIPPAYTDVWICTDPRGHLQATGRDARRRKQYRYHPRWAETRGLGKFDRVIAFGRALPRLRRRLRRDLRQRGFPRDKVLAVVVSLMAETLERVGNACYASSNRSYGLTTLRNHHIDFLRGGRARLRFRGKGGLDHDLEIDDARLVKLVRACQELPGQALFQYHDDDGTLQPVDSSDVNAYLREATGEHFTAKDFRTWGATLEAFRILATTPLPPPSRTGEPSQRALAQVKNAVVAEVASVLCNTPSVCRKAYIDPRVFAGWEDGSLARAAAGARGERQWELAALKFLAGCDRARASAARKQAKAAAKTSTHPRQRKREASARAQRA
ncbi:DNA topoisomerase IB [Luteimonas sp. MHLX1A]|uniref:DNA topoisomerase IB n=1 Tax=Alterluteimonas muca TaxID=2878684 RepID=UPI001E659D5C|nr:DNA topoisomerase IB [Luteimonas sp. MHLX1A]MCD9045180.1 DNA topoisomerase IB [Luteimonas sp. MHLX1A]